MSTIAVRTPFVKAHKPAKAPRNLPEAERLLTRLYAALDAAHAALGAHDCDYDNGFPCQLCDDVHGIAYMLKVACCNIDSQLLCTPEMSRRLAHYSSHG